MAPKTKKEFREQVAAEFTRVLSERGLNWKNGWISMLSPQQNAVTKKKYQGLNQFYLMMIAMQRGYTDPRWLTMTQIIDKNGYYHKNQKWHLQAGSKAVYVEYWYPYDLEKKKMLTWEQWNKLPDEEREDDEKYIIRYRLIPVFHASMVDGIPEWISPAPRAEQPIDQLVTKLSIGMNVPILFDGGDRAFYRPSEDKIHLPSPSAFNSAYDLNGTALHELTHATGHESRLNRNIRNIFGSEEYAYEELVAEIGSAFMAYGLDSKQNVFEMENHKAYVRSWIKAINDQPDILAKAISEAQKAAAYLDQIAERSNEEEVNRALSDGQIVPETQVDPQPAPVVEPKLGYDEKIEMVYRWYAINHVLQEIRGIDYIADLGKVGMVKEKGWGADQVLDAFDKHVVGRFNYIQEEYAKLAAEGASFSIYQIKWEAPDANLFSYRSIESLVTHGLKPRLDLYEKVYTMPLEPGMTLEDIYAKFNIDIPADFKGHSLSVSDLVVVDYPGHFSAHYVDSFGFQEVPEITEQLQHEKYGEQGKEAPPTNRDAQVVATLTKYGDGTYDLYMEIDHAPIRGLPSRTSIAAYRTYIQEKYGFVLPQKKKFQMRSEKNVISVGTLEFTVPNYYIRAEKEIIEPQLNSLQSSVDAANAQFSAATLLNQPVLFTRQRINRDSIEDGWYAYDLRSNGHDPDPIFLEKLVSVNHAGTILCRHQMPDLDAGQQMDIENGLLVNPETTISLSDGEEAFEQLFENFFPAENCFEMGDDD